MNENLDCRKCKTDLEPWNRRPDFWILYCPRCGAKLPKKQSNELYRMTTEEEISEIIQQHLLRFLNSPVGDISTADLAFSAWARENYDGVVFYHNYGADSFVARHTKWIRAFFEYANCCLDSDLCLKTQADGNDRLLVAVFLYATKHYIHDQLEIDTREGVLSKRRIKEIIALVKETEYDGEF